MLKAVSSITNAIGAVNYRGVWNASTNSPALTSSVGTKGDYYVVGTAGSTGLNGISNWGVGDWAVFNGSVWERLEGGADGNFINLSASGVATIGPNTLALSGAVVDVGNDRNSPSRFGMSNQNTGASATSGIALEAAGGGWQLDVPADVVTFANPLIGKFGGTEKFRFAADGSVLPGTDAGPSIGSAAKRWNTIYAATALINTSDARSKTSVSQMTDAEINASKQISKEIGTYKFLDAIASKGDAARTHIGMTVQRAIEIMNVNGLDPMNYGFICYDEWGDEFVHHSALEARNSIVDDSGNIIRQAQEAKSAWVEQTQYAGNRYGFRVDELLLFISRGFEARLSKLEGV